MEVSMDIEKFNKIFPLEIMEKNEKDDLKKVDKDDKKVKVKALKSGVELNPKLDIQGTL
jgi:hypothetical protein